MFIAKIAKPLQQFILFIKERSLSIFLENGRLLAQAIFTLLCVGLGIWFIIHEHTELGQVKAVLGESSLGWVLLAFLLFVIYIVLQGAMYVASFASVRHRIPIGAAIVLFLKRNLVSVFLPAGGISSLAFFTSDIEKRGITKTQIHFASSVYGFIGILSVFVVAVPLFLFSMVFGGLGLGEWLAFLSMAAILLIAYFMYQSIARKGRVYQWLCDHYESFELFVNDIHSNRIERRFFYRTLFYSILIEFVGIGHLYVAMLALHYEPSFFAAFVGYIISVIFLIVSPFLRGLGAIEVSMTFVLVKLGFTNIEAIAMTLFYRFFEFWLVLLAGLMSFLLQINRLLMRIVPALLLLALGIINIISVLTPAISERVHWLKSYLPVDAMVVSNYFVLVLGLFLLVVASFMLKGLKIAWWFGFSLTAISIIGNLLKGGDYEESIVALFVVFVLIYTKKEYYVKNNPRLRTVGIQTALLSMIAVMVYGVVGFYFLDKKHFNFDFGLLQSVRYALQNFLLVGSQDLVPLDRFASKFLLSINVSGFATMSFLIYTLIRPYFLKEYPTEEEMERPRELVCRWGHSALDYFKTYNDKMIFEPEDLSAFTAYRPSGNFAVVLENPVAPNPEQMKECIKQFDQFCFENGLKSIYYRVPEKDLPFYRQLRKKAMFLGQEGIVDLTTFSLEGGAKKSIRNAISKVKDRGYKAYVIQPPIKDGLLQKLKSVSDEWLETTGRSEIVFSQGMFRWEELKKQVLITVENSEEKIVAFLNIVPDYAPEEGTYDLIRKTADAPNGVMDFLLIEMFNYFKGEGLKYVNLGFAPMSGIDDPHTFKEKSMKFAYEKIRGFSQYKGLREYKEKFATVWVNRYLIYDHDYDLIQVPGALTKVIKP